MESSKKSLDNNHNNVEVSIDQTPQKNESIKQQQVKVEFPSSSSSKKMMKSAPATLGIDQQESSKKVVNVGVVIAVDKKAATIGADQQQLLLPHDENNDAECKLPPIPPPAQRAPPISQTPPALKKAHNRIDTYYMIGIFALNLCLLIALGCSISIGVQNLTRRVAEMERNVDEYECSWLRTSTILATASFNDSSPSSL